MKGKLERGPIDNSRQPLSLEILSLGSARQDCDSAAKVTESGLPWSDLSLGAARSPRAASVCSVSPPFRGRVGLPSPFLMSPRSYRTTGVTDLLRLAALEVRGDLTKETGWSVEACATVSALPEYLTCGTTHALGRGSGKPLRKGFQRHDCEALGRLTIPGARVGEVALSKNLRVAAFLVPERRGDSPRLAGLYVDQPSRQCTDGALEDASY